MLVGEWPRLKPNVIPVIIIVTNVGRRPMTIKSCHVRCRVGTEYKELKVYSKYDKLPVKIEESEDFELKFLGRQILSQDLDTIFVRDSSGKEWHVHGQDRQSILQYLKDCPGD